MSSEYQYLVNEMSIELRQAYAQSWWQIPVDALVVDLGAAGGAFPRANVLCDYTETEDHGAGLFKNLQTTPGQIKISNVNVENMHQFKDKEFKWSYLSHCAEHLYNPGKGMEELMRVSEGGMIGCPSAGYDTWWTHHEHTYMIMILNNILYFIKKTKGKMGAWQETLEELKKEGILLPQDEPLLEAMRSKMNTKMIFHPDAPWPYFIWQESFDYCVLKGGLNKIKQFPNLKEVNPYNVGIR